MGLLGDTRDRQYSIEQDLQVLSSRFPEVEVLTKPAQGTVIRARIFGVRGKKGRTNRQQEFLVEARLLGYPDVCPEAWVVETTPGNLRHINVFADGRICISAGGDYQRAWQENLLPWHERNLVAFFAQVDHVLRNPNLNSPAR